MAIRPRAPRLGHSGRIADEGARMRSDHCRPSHWRGEVFLQSVLGGLSLRNRFKHIPDALQTKEKLILCINSGRLMRLTSMIARALTSP